MSETDRPADPGSQSPDGQISQALVQTWSAASERAFATGLTDPENYVRVARLVAAVTEALRGLGRGTAPLLQAWQQHHDLVLQVAESQELLTTTGLDLEAVAGAAFAMRYREASAEALHDERLAAFRARPDDTTWATLEEEGYSPGDPFVPYRRLEVESTTGRALVITTRPDDNFASCVHAVQLLQLDLSTGELLPPAQSERPAEPDEFTTAAEREEMVTHLKDTGGA